MDKKLIYKWYLPWRFSNSAVVYTLIFILGITGLQAQNITRFEYFFDSDPGFGQGAHYNVVPPVSNITNLNFNVSIAPLAPGFHKLYMRAQDDSSRWSHKQELIFYKLVITNPYSEVTGGEYFIDTDPGFGLGVNIPITPDTNITNLGVNINITGLADGFHQLFVRVRDNHGNWSMYQKSIFLKNTVVLSLPNIVKAEYFLDTDPGFGNGNDIPVTPGSDLDNIEYTIDLTNVSNGFHSVYVRVKDENGKWSMAHNRSFYKDIVIPDIINIVKAEYFIDTDPGYGAGIDIPLTADTNISNLNYVADISALTDGFHKIYLRVMDDHNRWSQINGFSFYKQTETFGLPNVVKVEYYIDDDPGVGNGFNIPVTPGTNLSSVNYTANISSLPNGFHQLHVRAKDAQGNWSLTNSRAFYKETFVAALPKIAKLEYFIDTDPGSGNGVNVPLLQDSSDVEVAFNFDINSLSLGFHKLFMRTKDTKGKWSLTQMHFFYKQAYNDTLPNLVKVEYFYDTDPGFGNGFNVPVTPGIQIPFLAFSLDLSNLEFGQHQLNVRVKNANNKWSLVTRDTIFYYLDSLPTAVLNGPPSVCINGIAEFEVTLTGTPPWTLIYNTGEVIDTVSGILTSPYTFSVAPTTSGPHVAQVIKVHDVYYQGLYTGIPIEYEVNPLPASAGILSGADNVCSGTGALWYWINPVANASAYNWNIPAGATIVSGYNNSSSVLIDFTNVTSSGLVSVTPVNYCGSGASASIFVHIRPHPVVNAGPDLFIPYAGSDTLTSTVTGGTEPYSYYWSPWYYLNNSYLENPIASPPSTVTFTLQVSDAYGCSATDQAIVYVGVPEGTILTGNFTYDNSVNTPLNNSFVMVKQGNTVISSDTTDSAGDFMLTGIPAGYYYLTGTSDKPWGGANATDALLVLKHYVEMLTLTGLKFGGADVTASFGINASDAFLIAKRYTGLVSSFPSGDWYSDTKYFSAAPVGNLTENLSAICFGDVDGSYIPGAKLSNGVDIVNDGLLTVLPGQTIDLPLLATEDLELGALSLTLDIPANTQVMDVKPGKGAEMGNLIYNVVGNQLRIAWYSLNPNQLHNGDVVLWISVMSNRLGDNSWTSADGSSVANGMGQSMESVTFRMPKLSVEQSGFNLTENYPNPFSTNTLISFTLPEEGNVNLNVYNAVGQEISTLLNAEFLTAGKHTILFEAKDLPSGVYFYTLKYKAQTNDINLTRKMVIQK